MLCYCSDLDRLYTELVHGGHSAQSPTFLEAMLTQDMVGCARHYSGCRWFSFWDFLVEGRWCSVLAGQTAFEFQA